ncbi:PA2928 family protein [Jiangella endophytica]|uniref:PA2928 family protein n=1 Tax=Jiangella endophytica TaxID=1623398 RepID=UPI000E350449|nr:PA2928 family protein [Jiangella endophytica]
MRRRLGAAAMAVMIVVLVLGAYVVPGFVIRTTASIAGPPFLTTIDGRAVALVGYDDDGMPGLRPGGLSSGVLAIDVATGDTVWDAKLPDATWEPVVVAAGERYVYVRHTFGVAIIELDDGDTVARDEDVDGLGDEVPHGRWDNYVYDPRREAVLFATDEGETRQFPLDEVAAVAADDATQDTWGCQLGREGGAAPITYDVTRAVTETRDVGLVPPDGTPAGLATTRLHVVEDGVRRELSPVDFHDAGLVQEVVPRLPPERACAGVDWPYDIVEPGEEAVLTTAGLAGGHVVVQSSAGPNDEESRRLTVVDVRTGAITATLDVRGGVAVASTAPSGEVVLVVEADWEGPFGSPGGPWPTDHVVIVGTDGAVRDIVVAEKGWFGL